MGGNETKTQVPVFKTPMGKLARCGTQVLAGVGIPSGVAARWAQLSPAPKTALCPSRRHTGWRWRSGSRLFRLPGVGPKLDFSLRFPAGKAPGGPASLAWPQTGWSKVAVKGGSSLCCEKEFNSSSVCWLFVVTKGKGTHRAVGWPLLLQWVLS